MTRSKSNKSTLSPQKTFSKWIFLPLIFFPLIIYYHSLSNELTHWDDNKYITENEYIKVLKNDGLPASVAIAFKSIVMGNYHPLTMLSFSMEYKLFGLNPKPYHATNLFLHLLNTLLVFVFIWLLTKQQWVAFITALLFGIHPMHVESVAWVSERKDVLYAFFYLMALCVYVLNMNAKRRAYTVIIFFLFVCSLLSKGMAVTLPLCFFLIDYFFDKRISKQSIIEKLPFLLLSLVFGAIAIYSQQKVGALTAVSYSFFEKCLFASYGILMYLLKSIFPYHLSCYYSYPLKSGGLYPIVFYIAPVVVLTMGYLVYRSGKMGKDLIFGLGFFMATIFLVLQFLSVGGAIIADRYTYLPYVGLFFIVARYINKLLDADFLNRKLYKISLFMVLGAAVVILTSLSAKRTKVWHDSLLLWNDAIDISKQGNQSYISYYCRGQAYHKAKQYDKAIADFTKALTFRHNYPDAFYDRGYAYDAAGNNQQALSDYSLAIKYKASYSDAYCNRGNIYYRLKRYKLAISDYDSALKYNPEMPGVYSNRGVCYYLLGDYPLALKDILKARTFGFEQNNELLTFLLEMKRLNPNEKW